MANTPNLDLENVNVLLDTDYAYNQLVSEIIAKINNNNLKIDELPNDFILSTEKGATNGVASLGNDGIIPKAQLPIDSGSVERVADITTRDAIINLYDNKLVFVIDASADLTVTSGWAMYIYSSASLSWTKIIDGESLDINLTWDDISNKPDVFPPETHTHAQIDINATDIIDLQNNKVDILEGSRLVSETEIEVFNDKYSKTEVDDKIADVTFPLATTLVDGLMSKEYVTQVDSNKTDILTLQTQNGAEVLTTTAQTLSGAINETKTRINNLDADVDDHEIRLVKLENNIEYNVGSWAEVQQIVRGGKAESYFSIGDQFVATYDGVEYVWDIIGIDHDTPTNTDYVHSLTIQARDCLRNVQFDAPEPINTDANRRQYGNNRYIHSAIKQWLNSNDAVFTWVSKHQYDAAPTGAPYTGPGFLKLLDPELVAVIGAVNKQVAKATVDGGGQDLFSDKVFLLSRFEVYGGAEGTVDGEKPYKFYENMEGASTTDPVAGRIKLLSNAASSWWLRSPYIGNSYFPRNMNTAGRVNNNGARYAYGLAPACCIV